MYVGAVRAGAAAGLRANGLRSHVEGTGRIARLKNQQFYNAAAGACVVARTLMHARVRNRKCLLKQRKALVCFNKRFR